ncbi:MAG: UDP-galactopyranose mutase [Firmicutes bacterium]|nr:UDP-galactopyranose mutase [Bacillota bacterium]
MNGYDYLIVGAGLFGGVFAREAADKGKKVLVIDKRPRIGGNCASEMRDGIDVHLYGAHIFHTDYEDVWEYVNRFSRFNNFVNSPIASYRGKLYNLPFNMNTFYALWGVRTPEEAESKLDEQRAAYRHITEPKNLEEKALTLCGRDIFETLIKGYTEKQWGRDARELPPFIISRLPFRLAFDNNYFTDRYQGIPEDGYAALFERLFNGIEVKRNSDFFADREAFCGVADKIIFTGRVDEYFDFKLGALEYRSLSFETETLKCENYQGVAVVNYTDFAPPYTRVIEHKHFRPAAKSPVTVVTKEYPAEFRGHNPLPVPCVLCLDALSPTPESRIPNPEPRAPISNNEPYYVINDARNNALYAEYKKLADAEKEKGVVFGGRLAEYRYYDMDDVILSALTAVKKELY